MLLGRAPKFQFKDGGAGVYGGYRFNDYVGVELGYFRLLSASGAGGKLTADSLPASAVGYWPLSNDFSLFGRLGVNSVKTKFTGPGASSARENRALIGVGAEYNFSKNVALRAEYQRPASNVSTLFAGVKFSF